MTEESNNPFGITREEVINLAAQKIADREADEDYLQGLASKKIEERIEAIFKESIMPAVKAKLADEMERLLNTEIVPVTIWGDKAGAPTTMRAAIVEQARDYWNVNVDKEGRPTSGWTSTKLTRAEWLIKKITGEEFSAAVKQNLTNIVGAFKDALREQAQKDIGEHLNKILVVKTKQD